MSSSAVVKLRASVLAVINLWRKMMLKYNVTMLIEGKDLPSLLELVGPDIELKITTQSNGSVPPDITPIAKKIVKRRRKSGRWVAEDQVKVTLPPRKKWSADNTDLGKITEALSAVDGKIISYKEVGLICQRVCGDKDHTVPRAHLKNKGYFKLARQ
jgi:hypothetical protein